MKKRLNVLKSVRKCQFIRYYDNYEILAWENIKKAIADQDSNPRSLRRSWA